MSEPAWSGSGSEGTPEPAAAASGESGLQVVLEEASMVYQSRRGRWIESLKAVDPVSQVVPAGRFISIIGPSGCGKSTLLEMVAGLRSPSSGRVLIDGETVGRPHPDSAIVFQEDSLLPWRTAEANVALALEAKGLPKAEREHASREALRAVGLGGFEDRHPRELSGGMRQRVAVARAFVVNPGLLLMDEPFASLDQQNRVILGAELVRLWEQHRPTVVFVTHDFNEAVFLSDEVWVMSARPGRIKDIIEVPLSRPRTLDLTSSQEFHDLTGQLWNSLQEEF